MILQNLAEGSLPEEMVCIAFLPPQLFKEQAVFPTGSLSIETGGGRENFASLDSDEIATVFLPPQLFEEQDVVIIFAVYDDGILFPIDHGGEATVVGTPVASATVAGQEFSNLEDGVLIILRLNPVQDEVGCFFQ